MNPVLPKPRPVQLHFVDYAVKTYTVIFLKHFKSCVISAFFSSFLLFTLKLLKISFLMHEFNMFYNNYTSTSI